MKPSVCILKTDGTNCDQETAFAFKKVGAHVDIIQFNSLRLNKAKLHDYQILVIPGGFSYGDDIASGKIFAIELMMLLRNELDKFIKEGKLIIGICNGFQVLTRAGILSYNSAQQEVTLLNNNSGKFECRWIKMKVESNPCIFTKGLQGMEISLPIAHGEGRFFATESTLLNIEKNNLVVLRYTKNGETSSEYPFNPNGSLNSIAGICDTTGQILGLMPHPERFVDKTHYPFWRKQLLQPIGLEIFANGVAYARQL